MKPRRIFRACRNRRRRKEIVIARAGKAIARLVPLEA
jgi:hypothetical protein